ncbi:hypothetical protein P2W68_08110 [Chryseobacterium arthrosphaerae]|uniref:hypothetical protein n=1 Tax=Chryseobacterium arthrosphaerae TaxID=651561 RepID=UPI0023E23AC6|nr:hypothetical protein [Chryseobacterium arthrosphaerae]WES99574.1 hypothetical protein P2W68_08110 [Chryseobacterium arthrosphaerae]
MKTPDLNDFQPIDKIKLVSGNVMNIQCKDETLTCYINPRKIDFDEIDNLSYFEQEQYEIILDRIINREDFIESKYKEGIEEIRIKLKDIGDLSAIR